MKPCPAFPLDLAAVGLLLVAGAGCVGDASSRTVTDPTEGSCGSANGTATSSAPATGLCGAGTASTVSGSGPWTWMCAGSSGGATANCSAGVATGPALAITTSSLPSGLVGSAYSATLGATGGSQPYGWSATETLPAWLTLSATGVLSGTPAAAGTVTLKFQVVDSVSATSSVTLSLTITALPPFFSGCAAPPGTPSGRIYYSDPVNGTMSNDGSQSKPWGSLSAIIAAKKLPPDNGAAVQPGDAIYLTTGGHGDVSLNASNTDFITVAAAPGQTPTLSRLTMDGASHWVLRGLTVQALNSGFSMGMRVGGSDLVVEGNAVLSQPDVSAWTQSDWQTKALFYAINASGNCISLLGNHITNVGFAIGISGTNILVRGNTIDHFGDDGIDFGQGTGSGTIGNIEISGNVITNNLDIGDNNHNDGIQGWVLNGTTGHDVTIDSNVVIVKTDPTLPNATYTFGGWTSFLGASIRREW